LFRESVILVWGLPGAEATIQGRSL
jgi:hypothetical protein